MRYLLLVLSVLFAFGGAPAHADPILATVGNATMFMRPNFGTGDNISFKFSGPGLDIEGIAGMACFDWCTGGPIPPGTPINLTQIFTSNFTRAMVGGVVYDPNTEFGLFDSLFDDTGGLSGSARGFVGAGATFREFFISLPSGGSWTLNFTPVRDQQGRDTQAFVNGTFAAGTATPTPEPGTLALMLLGSAGIGIIARRTSSLGRTSPKIL